jgi:hypothetical protein
LGRLSVVLLLLAGCATTPSGGPGADSKPTIQTTLDALPRCSSGADVGLLIPKATMCTRKHCQEKCCNKCSWAATFETKNGQPVLADPAKVQALLGVPDSALDCEIAAWAEILASQSVALEPPGCVVR